MNYSITCHGCKGKNTHKPLFYKGFQIVDKWSLLPICGENKGKRNPQLKWKNYTPSIVDNVDNS